ncbi:MAG: hypothetical protein KTR25_10510 [Myxococcales bacterium]|nr:hypothetical protein [Myxococcales bacterium]
MNAFESDGKPNYYFHNAICRYRVLTEKSVWVALELGYDEGLLIEAHKRFLGPRLWDIDAQQLFDRVEQPSFHRFFHGALLSQIKRL